MKYVLAPFEYVFRNLLDLGQEVFIIRGTFNKGKKRLLYRYLHPVSKEFGPWLIYQDVIQTLYNPYILRLKPVYNPYITPYVYIYQSIYLSILSFYLSYPILSYPILSYPILSYPIYLYTLIHTYLYTYTL